MSAALVIHTDGDITELHLPDTSKERLRVMYDAIGCTTVDVVALTTRLDMWLDDEGLYTQEPNVLATMLAIHHGLGHQPYYGPVVLCSADEDGNSVDLTRDQLLALLVHLIDLTG